MQQVEVLRKKEFASSSDTKVCNGRDLLSSIPCCFYLACFCPA